jgi:hypothetical protein
MNIKFNKPELKKGILKYHFQSPMKSSILHYKTVQILPKNKLKLSEILLMMERLIITENILNLQTILMENGFTIFIMLKEIFIKN